MLLVLWALAAPLTLQVDGWWRKAGQITVTVRWLNLRKLFRAALVRDKHGHHLITLPGRQQESPHEAPPDKVHRGFVTVGKVLGSPRFKRYLMRHVHLIRLEGMVCVSLSDAASTALLSGVLQGLVRQIPPKSRRRIRLRVMPGFRAEASSLGVRCIISIHLGNLLIASGLLFLSLTKKWLQTAGQRRKKHGTSHWRPDANGHVQHS